MKVDFSFLSKIRRGKKSADGRPVLTPLEEKIVVCREYTKLWSYFFRFFADGLAQTKITEKNEAVFFQTIGKLSQGHYAFTHTVGDQFQHGQDILELLSDVVSLANLKSLSEAQFSQFQIRWHEVFIEMYKALGRLSSQLPLTEEEKAAQKSKEATKGAAVSTFDRVQRALSQKSEANVPGVVSTPTTQSQPGTTKPASSPAKSVPSSKA